MPKVEVDLDLSAEQLILYYSGSAKNIRAYSIVGQSLSFPVELLRKFVTPTGIKGRFVIYYSFNGKCETIVKIS